MERDKLKKEFSKKPTGVFFVDGNKAFYFEQSLGAPIPMEITADIFSDLELISGKKLDALIKKFIITSKFGPKNIIILLSTQVTYDRDFPHGSIEVEKHIQEFLDLVPFESVISKKALFSGRTKVIAANKEFCDAIKSSFVNAGFIVSGIYPLSLCLELAPELQSSMDLNLVINKVPELKDFNLMPTPEVALSATKKQEAPDKNRLFLLIGVMVLLGVVLAFVLYKNVLAPQKSERSNELPKPKTRTKSVAPKISPAEILESSPSAENSVIVSPVVSPVISPIISPVATP